MKKEVKKKTKKDKEKEIEKELLKEADYKGCEYAALAMIFLTFIYFVYDIFTGKNTNPAFYSIITIFNAVLFGYRAYKVKKSRKLNIATSFIWGLLTLLLMLEYFKVV